MARKRSSPRATHPAPAAAHPAPPALVPPRPGWRRLEHVALPRPTYSPAALAFGITLLAWGIVTSWLISAVGLIVFALALAGWIGEMFHDH